MSRESTRLDELVIQRALRGDKPHCPYCKGRHLTVRSHASTLVGGGPPDPNHHWYETACDDCGQSFVRQVKAPWTWYTEGGRAGRVLEGIAMCFEAVIYTCQCGGEVTREHTGLDGTSSVAWLTWSTERGKEYRTFYGCASCGKRIEVDE